MEEDGPADETEEEDGPADGALLLTPPPLGVGSSGAQLCVAVVGADAQRLSRSTGVTAEPEGARRPLDTALP